MGYWETKAPEHMIEGGPLQISSYFEIGDGLFGNKIARITRELKSRIEIASHSNC